MKSKILKVVNKVKMKKNHHKYSQKYFFDKGISFSCKRCGNCCTGIPGLVRLNSVEIEEIANVLILSQKEFKKKYLYKKDNLFYIQEKINGDCIFYKNGCKIYKHRPEQCQTYPFWFENLRSEQNWQKNTSDCAGIGQGKLYTKEDILIILEKSSKSWKK